VNDKRNFLITLLVVLLIFAAGFIGWLLASDKNDTTQSGETSISSEDEVKSLIDYRLPDGWKDAKCDSIKDTVFVIPAGSDGLDCNDSPSAPIKISIDPGDTKDCNELQNNTNVKKHVCISLYINNHRSLKASTEYLASSPYGRETTLNAYYIDIGGKVIKLENIFNLEDKYGVGFEQLVNSAK
jgi:hypothetical protein